jgi:hypothetical protein
MMMYGNQIDSLASEYDQSIEKDPEVFNSVFTNPFILLVSQNRSRLRHSQDFREALPGGRRGRASEGSPGKEELLHPRVGD